MVAEPVSVARARAGVLLFLVWWLPAYLLGPAVAELLGKGGDATARHEITIGIVVVQTVLGLTGLYLAGRELFSTLGAVRRRRVLPVAWSIVWSGNTQVREEDRRPAKERTGRGRSRRGEQP